MADDECAGGHVYTEWGDLMTRDQRECVDDVDCRSLQCLRGCRRAADELVNLVDDRSHPLAKAKDVSPSEGVW
jgi:hypothetical protein